MRASDAGSQRSVGVTELYRRSRGLDTRLDKCCSLRFAILLAEMRVPPTNETTNSQTLRFGTQDPAMLRTIGAARPKEARVAGRRPELRSSMPSAGRVTTAGDGAPFRKVARLDNRIASAISVSCGRSVGQGGWSPVPLQKTEAVVRGAEYSAVLPLGDPFRTRNGRVSCPHLRCVELL